MEVATSKGSSHAVSTEAFDDSLNIMLLKVVAFRDREGHCRIPQRYEKDPELGVWVKNRRSEKGKGTLIKREKIG